MQIPVHNMAGEIIGRVELRDDIFAVPVHTAVMHQAYVRQMANARLGTHKTKTRGEVSGGAKKPWRQKGTGRARQGSTRAPQWYKGGIVFGPQPRSYAQKMPRQMRRLAYKSALSVKAREGQIIVLDDLQLDQPKTQQMAAILNRLTGEASALILLPERNENVELSVRNLPYVGILRAQYLNIRDLLGYDYLIIPQKALSVIEEILG